MAILPLLPVTPFESPPLYRVALLHHPRVPAAWKMMDRLREMLEGDRVVAFGGSVWDTEGIQAVLPELDVCITMGGDGSLLRAARLGAPYGVPVLGINMGKLGFLAELEPDEVATRLQAILSGNYWLEERLMVTAELHRDGEVLIAQECLNEVVVARRHLSRVIRVEISIDGFAMSTYTADGVLVATPTGSTAYSLAAGGPVLHPETRNLVLTPISAHLSVRSPLVLPERTEVRLAVHTDHQAGASFDGQSDVEMRQGDAVIVRAGPRSARFVRAQERAYFYHTLIHKLGIRH